MFGRFRRDDECKRPAVLKGRARLERYECKSRGREEIASTSDRPLTGTVNVVSTGIWNTKEFVNVCFHMG